MTFQNKVDGPEEPRGMTNTYCTVTSCVYIYRLLQSRLVRKHKQSMLMLGEHDFGGGTFLDKALH
jgi:hypothetical protein